MSANRCLFSSDRVYGLLGLYQSSNETTVLPKLLTPDYNKPLMDILQDATRFTITERKSLNFFRYIVPVLSKGNEGRALPSWVPPWHRSQQDVLEAFRLAEFFRCDGGIGLDVSNILVFEDPNILSVLGFVVGFISATTPAFPERTMFDVKSVNCTLSEIDNLLGASHDKEQLGRTLICDQIDNGVRATRVDCLDFSKCLTFIELHDKLPPTKRQICQSNGEAQYDLWRAARYYEAIYGTWNNCRFFCASPGYIGLGPKSMQIGDTLAVLYGCKWPVILHPVGQHYEIIGICYTDGIMYVNRINRTFDRNRNPCGTHMAVSGTC